MFKATEFDKLITHHIRIRRQSLPDFINGIGLAPDQIRDEVVRISQLFDEVYNLFKLPYTIELSTMPEDHMGTKAVSYTHLDVYKRQILYGPEYAKTLFGAFFTFYVKSYRQKDFYPCKFSL